MNFIHKKPKWQLSLWVWIALLGALAFSPLACKTPQTGTLDGGSKPEAKSEMPLDASTTPPPDGSTGPLWSIEVDDAHRACEETSECVGIYVHCSNCALENCEGVHKDHASNYENLLNCAGFDGPECDWDCHPISGLTQVVCENRTCKIIDNSQ